MPIFEGYKLKKGETNMSDRGRKEGNFSFFFWFFSLIQMEKNDASSIFLSEGRKILKVF